MGVVRGLGQQRLARGDVAHLFRARPPGTTSYSPAATAIAAPRTASIPEVQKFDTRVTGRGANPIASASAAPESPTRPASSGSAVASQAASTSAMVSPASPPSR